MKLVRDKIINIIKEEGRQPEFYVADDHEMKIRIAQKIKEELEEFEQNPSIEELADLYEVFLSLIRVYGFEFDGVIKEADKKRAKKGAFLKKHILLKRNNDE